MATLFTITLALSYACASVCVHCLSDVCVIQWLPLSCARAFNQQQQVVFAHTHIHTHALKYTCAHKAKSRHACIISRCTRITSITLRSIDSLSLSSLCLLSSLPLSAVTLSHSQFRLNALGSHLEWGMQRAAHMSRVNDVASVALSLNCFVNTLNFRYGYRYWPNDMRRCRL